MLKDKTRAVDYIEGYSKNNEMNESYANKTWHLPYLIFAFLTMTNSEIKLDFENSKCWKSSSAYLFEMMIDIGESRNSFY